MKHKKKACKDTKKDMKKDAKKKGGFVPFGKKGKK